MRGGRILLILHNLPAEYYPPLCNLIDIFAETKSISIVLATAPVPPGQSPYQNPACRIVRYREPAGTRFKAVRRLWAFTRIAFRELRSLAAERNAAILSIEPHSALPLLLWRRWLHREIPLLIHHHEFYRTEDFSPRGHRLLRLLWAAEAKFNFRHAAWISQTNEVRLERFHAQNPDLLPERLHILPNYPPAEWYGGRNHTRESLSPPYPLRLVYVGSISYNDTYIREVSNWVAQHPDKLRLDVFSQHPPNEIKAFFNSLGAPNIRFEADGIPYESLPDCLVEYHVGLILYKGTTLNFVYNLPNKLFEYLACGLDVWYPKEMRGMDAMRREDVFPKVCSLDFRAIDGIDVAHLTCREGLSEDRRHFTCEEALQDLRNEIETLSFSVP